MADLKNFYQNAKNKGIIDSSVDYDSFAQSMSNEADRKSFYKYATDNGLKIGKEDEFYSYLDAHMQPAEPSQNPSVAANPAPLNDAEYQTGLKKQEEAQEIVAKPQPYWSLMPDTTDPAVKQKAQAEAETPIPYRVDQPFSRHQRLDELMHGRKLEDLSDDEKNAIGRIVLDEEERARREGQGLEQKRNPYYTFLNGAEGQDLIYRTMAIQQSEREKKDLMGSDRDKDVNRRYKLLANREQYEKQWAKDERIFEEERAAAKRHGGEAIYNISKNPPLNPAGYTGGIPMMQVRALNEATDPSKITAESLKKIAERADKEQQYELKKQINARVNEAKQEIRDELKKDYNLPDYSDKSLHRRGGGFSEEEIALNKAVDAKYAELGGKSVDEIYKQLQDEARKQVESASKIDDSDIAVYLDFAQKKMYEKFIDENTPKSDLEYYLRKTIEGNIIGQLASLYAITPTQRAYSMQGLQNYEEQMGGTKSFFLNLASTATNITTDPLMYIAPVLGSAIGGKFASAIGGRGLGKIGYTGAEELAKRAILQKGILNTANRLASGAVTFAAIDAGHDVVNQLYYPVYNPETGEYMNAGWNPLQTLAAAGKGSVTGTLFSYAGVLGDKAQAAVSKLWNETAGVLAGRGTHFMLGTNVMVGTSVAYQLLQGKSLNDIDWGGEYREATAMQLFFDIKGGVEGLSHTYNEYAKQGRKLTIPETFRANWEQMKKGTYGNTFTTEEIEQFNNAGIKGKSPYELLLNLNGGKPFESMQDLYAALDRIAADPTIDTQAKYKLSSLIYGKADANLKPIQVDAFKDDQGRYVVRTYDDAGQNYETKYFNTEKKAEDYRKEQYDVTRNNLRAWEESVVRNYQFAQEFNILAEKAVEEIQKQYPQYTKEEIYRSIRESLDQMHNPNRGRAITQDTEADAIRTAFEEYIARVNPQVEDGVNNLQYDFAKRTAGITDEDFSRYKKLDKIEKSGQSMSQSEKTELSKLRAKIERLTADEETELKNLKGIKEPTSQQQKRIGELLKKRDSFYSVLDIIRKDYRGLDYKERSVFDDYLRSLAEAMPKPKSDGTQIAGELGEGATPDGTGVQVTPDGGAPVDPRREAIRQEVMAEIQPNTHKDGNLYQVKMPGDNGMAGYIVSGDVKVGLDEDGNFHIQSNDVLTVRFSDGSVKQMSAKDLGLLVEPTKAEDAIEVMTEERMDAQTMERMENGEEPIMLQDENGNLFGFFPTETDGVLEDEQGNRYTTEQLANAGWKAVVMEDNGHMRVEPLVEEQPKVPAEPQQPIAQEPQTPEPVVPNIETMSAADYAGAAVEYMGSREYVDEYLDGEIKKVQQQLGVANRKKVGNVTDMADFKAKKDAIEAEKKALQDRLDKLTEAREKAKSYLTIAEREQRAQAEAERQAAAEAARIAREQAAAEAAAKAEQERIDRELKKGVPDFVEDNDKDARARGFHVQNGVVIRRQEPLQPLATGKATTVQFAKGDNGAAEAHHVLIPVSKAQPSHINGQRNPAFFISEAQPKDRRDQVSKVTSDMMAQNIHPDEIVEGATAYVGAPVLNSRGEAVQGNNRLDALIKMYQSHPESVAKYKQYLIDNAAALGYTEADIETIKNNDVIDVRMLDNVTDEQAIQLGQKKATDLETGGVQLIDPQVTASQLGNKIQRFSEVLLKSEDDEATLADLVLRNGKPALEYLQRLGIINDAQMQSAFDSRGNITAEAKAALQGVLKQVLFQNVKNDNLPILFDAIPLTAQKAILQTIVRDLQTKQESRLAPHIQEAIEALYDALQDNMVKEAKTEADVRRAMQSWASQIKISADSDAENLPGSEKFSNFARELATLFKYGRQKEIANKLDEYYNAVQGTKDMFGETPAISFEDAVKQVFGIEYKPIAPRGTVSLADIEARLAQQRAEHRQELDEYLSTIADSNHPFVLFGNDNFIELLTKLGASQGKIDYVKRQLALGKTFEGFKIGNRLYLNADGLPTTDKARSKYVHERQHLLTTPEQIERVMRASSRDDLDVLVERLSESDGAYSNEDHDVLSEEFISFAMEVAYDVDTDAELEAALKAVGVNDELINIIKEINNEQRANDQRLGQSERLSNARRHASINADTEGRSPKDRRDTRSQSAVVGEEGLRPARSGSMGTGVRGKNQGSTDGAGLSEVGSKEASGEAAGKSGTPKPNANGDQEGAGVGEKRGLGDVKSASDIEIGGALVDRLEDMGVSVSTDLQANRDALKAAKADKSEAGAIHYYKTPSGQQYGFSYKGKVYLDPTKINAELPLHEYGHLWAEALRRLNPENWQHVVDTIKADKDAWEFVKSLRPELTDENEIAEEVIATFSGKKGAERLKAEYERMHGKDANYKSKWGNIFKNISKAIQDFWKAVGDFLNIKYESAEQVYDQVLKDFVDNMNPWKRVSDFLRQRDAEYVQAAESGDIKTATNIFYEALKENIGNGITPYMSVGTYNNLKRLAKGVKTRDAALIKEAADLIAPLIPDNAVLIPAPSHSGTATDMLDLAKAIAEVTGSEVADVLRSAPRESQYQAKKTTGVPMASKQLGIAVEGEIPADKTPIIIDNVVDSGNTAEACVQAVGKGVVVTLADSAEQYGHAASLKSAAPVLRDKDGKVIPLSKRFDLSGSRYLGRRMYLRPDDLRLSVSGTQTIPVGKNTLVGLHNISAEKLRKALKMGGLANPSAAVIDLAKQDHHNYGDISLVMPSSLVDSETGRNAGTYAGDAYTPTYPGVEFHAGKDTDKRIAALTKGLPKVLDDAIQRHIRDYMDGNTYNSGLEYLFLKERGQELPVEHTPRRYPYITIEEIYKRLGMEYPGYYDSSSYAKYEAIPEDQLAEFNLWLQNAGNQEEIDKRKANIARMRSEGKDNFANTLESKWKERMSFANYDSTLYRIVNDGSHAGEENPGMTLDKAKDLVETQGLRPEFEEWMQAKIDDLGYTEVLFDGWTPSGNRRLLPNTLENASKIMNRQDQTNYREGVSVSETKSMLMDKFRTLAQIRKHKDILEPDEEKIKEAYEAVSDDWLQLGVDFRDYTKADGHAYGLADNPYTAIDTALYRIQEAMFKRDPIAWLNKEYRYSIPADNEWLGRIMDLKQRITNLPARYFETKFRRPVYLDEFRNAVVPNDLPTELRDGLEKAGLTLFEYDPKEEGARRAATLQATEGEGIRFSVSGGLSTDRTLTKAAREEMQQIKDAALADGTFMKAPNGKRSNLNERQWLQVRTRAFKRWFGDWENDPENASKIIDWNGEPMVMYHGRSPIANFTEFMLSPFGRYGEGVYFTSNRLSAENYSRRYGADKGAENVVSAFLNIRNPYNSQVWWASAIKDDLTQYDGLISPNGLYFEENETIVKDPNQIKSATNNNGDFSEENDDIRFSISNQNNDIFYSNAERAVEGIKQEKATPEQWRAMIEKAGGLKAGEDKWLGLSDWLAQQRPNVELQPNETRSQYIVRLGEESKRFTISKQDILDYIREHKIQIEEQEYGEYEEDALFLERKDEFKRYYDEAAEAGEEDPNEVAWDRMIEEYGDDFSLGYYAVGDELMRDNDSDYAQWEADSEGRPRAINETRLRYTTWGLENKREIALIVPDIEEWNENDEIHFGDAGDGRAIAWVRFGDAHKIKYGENGEELADVLVIDEIQSKRHQEGREKGYKASPTEEETKEIIRREKVANSLRGDKYDFEREMKVKYGSFDFEDIFKSQMTDAERDEWRQYDHDVDEAEAELHELKDRFPYDPSTPPVAPFEKNWHELAMKRILRFAAENGYDKVAWTTGEQQAKRYDIGKEIDHIVKTDENTYEVYPTSGLMMTLEFDENGMYADEYDREYNGKSMSDIFGKDLAKRLKEMPVDETLQGDGLRVGYDGMKGFYDDILPRFMQKYGKKWGVQVGEVTMPDLEEGYQTMHAIDINDAMRESVMEGQPMFSITGSRGAANIDKMEGVTIRMDNLAAARQMEEDGKDAKTIRMATGWERGADGKWRYEIDDVQLNTDNVKANFRKLDRRGVTAPMVWYHNKFTDIIADSPERKQLLAAYPQLADLDIEFYDYPNKERGAYSPEKKKISVNRANVRSVDECRSVLLHEIQHAIQEAELFAKGTSKEQIQLTWKLNNEVHNKVDEYFDKMGFKEWLTSHNGDKAFVDRLMQVIHMFPNRDFNIHYLFVETLPRDKQIDAIDVLGDANDVIQSNRDAIYGADRKGMTMKPDELYHNAAGEVESRNVQNRMNLTPEERRERLLAETEDVAREDQVVIMNAFDMAEEKNMLENLHISDKIRNFAAQIVDNAKKLIGNSDSRTQRPGRDSGRVSYEAARRMAATADRGDIRVLEPELPVSDRVGYFLDLPRTEQRARTEAESQRLIWLAKENGLFIERKETEKFGTKKNTITRESTVYEDKEQGKHIKVKDPYALAVLKGNYPEDAIYEHIIHNLLFPDTRYTFMGISEDLGDVRFVLSQETVDAIRNATDKEVDAYMKRLGLRKADKYTYENDMVRVTDVTGDNALVDKDGHVRFIDPVISLKVPARQILNEVSDEAMGDFTMDAQPWENKVQYAARIAEEIKRENPKDTSLDEAIRFSITVNHNSPYLLKRADGSFVDPETGERLGFDLRFIGKGEGGQAHGYGSYFSARDIRQYADQPLMNGGITQYFDVDKIDAVDPHGRSAAVRAIETYRRTGIPIDQHLEYQILDYQKAADKHRAEGRDDVAEQVEVYVKEFKAALAGYTGVQRHHYSVEIPDNDGTNYIEENDEPMDETELAILRNNLEQEILKIDKEKNQYYVGHENDLYHNILVKFKAGTKGRDIYPNIAYMLEDYYDNPEEAASKFLHDAGFVGIHYDGRRDGECYVIFNPDDAVITNHIRFSVTSGKSVLPKTPDASQVEHPMRSTYNTNGDIVGDDQIRFSKSAAQVERELAQDGYSDESPIRFSVAYHGSAADFDKFLMEKVGTGEESQAFGWGLYFADAKAIAKDYAERQAKQPKVRDKGAYLGDEKLNYRDPKTDLDCVAFAMDYTDMRHMNAQYESSRDALRNAIDGKIYHSEGKIDFYRSNRSTQLVEHEQEILGYLKRAQKYIQDKGVPDIQFRGERHLYEVSIPDNDGTNYLIEGKEYSGQELRDIADKVVPILRKKYGKDSAQAEFFDSFADFRFYGKYTTTGDAIYRKLANAIEPNAIMRVSDETWKTTSEILNEAGFVGIEYAAGQNYGLKGAPEDAKNYVIFNEDDIEITDHIRFSVSNPSTLSRSETVTKVLVQQANNNYYIMQSALKKVTADLKGIRAAMRMQSDYDRNVVASLLNLYNTLLQENGVWAQYMPDTTRRIATQIVHAIGKQNITEEVNTIMDYMVHAQAKAAQRQWDKLRQTPIDKINISGVVMQGKVALEGQHALKALNEVLDPENGITLLTLRGDHTDPNKEVDGLIDQLMQMEDNATDESQKLQYKGQWIGYEIAAQYLERIQHIQEERKQLDLELKKAQGNMALKPAARKQLAESIKQAMRDNYLDQADAYMQSTRDLQEYVSTQEVRAKDFIRRQDANRDKIRSYAQRDLEGLATNPNRNRTRGNVARSIWDAFASPIRDLQSLLRLTGLHAPDGEGYLYNHFMRNWMDGADMERTGIVAASKKLDEKISELTHGKYKTWEEAARKINDASHNMFGITMLNGVDGKDMPVTEEIPLNAGNALYIYAVNKMNDGRMKLNGMNITEEDVQALADKVREQFGQEILDVVDWVQSEFFSQLRNRYNPTHEALFGAPMDAIENYFPLRINANARQQNEDLSEPDTDAARLLAGTSTGAIKRRTRNSLPLDVRNADFFQEVIRHISQMERWNAFAQWNRDANILFSDINFRNRIKGMKGTIYGEGDKLYNYMKDAFRVAIGTYKPNADGFSKEILNAAKGVTSAKINFRVFTALKQIASFPAFFTYMQDGTFVTSYLRNWLTPHSTMKWAKENLPNFEKRVSKRDLGDMRLMSRSTDWQWNKRILEWSSKYGMFFNVFFDTLTCATGARAVYDSHLADYLKKGYSEEDARNRARQDAEQAFNTSQQSSEGAFMAPIQMDRNALTAGLTVFRTSPMQYTRNFFFHVRGLLRKIGEGKREEQIAFRMGQYKNDGLNYEQARKAAENDYNKSIRADVTGAVVYGALLGILWRLVGSFPYLFFGDDDDKKKQIVMDAVTGGAFVQPITGLIGGSYIESALDGNGLISSMFAPELPFTQDAKRAEQYLQNNKYAEYASQALSVLMQTGTGFDPQTAADMITRVVTTFDSEQDIDAAEKALRVTFALFSVPESQYEQVLVDQVLKDEREYEDALKDYERYQSVRTAPLTWYLRDAETDEKAQKKYKKDFDKLINERKKLKQ